MCLVEVGGKMRLKIQAAMKSVCMCCPKGGFVTQCIISQFPQTQEKYLFLFRPGCSWKSCNQNNPSFFTAFMHYIPMCSTWLIKKHPPPNISIRLSNQDTTSLHHKFPSCLLAQGCWGVIQRVLSFFFYHLWSLVTYGQAVQFSCQLSK